jgi:hypothetical protein
VTYHVIRTKCDKIAIRDKSETVVGTAMFRERGTGFQAWILGIGSRLIVVVVQGEYKSAMKQRVGIDNGGGGGGSDKRRMIRDIEVQPSSGRILRRVKLVPISGFETYSSSIDIDEAYR